MKAIGVLVLVVGLGAGIYFAFLQPTEIPELTLLGPNGQNVTTAQLRGDADAILFTIMMPNDAVSKFSGSLVTKQMATTSQSVAFAGLVFGTKDQAAKAQQDWGLSFPCYGLRDAPDPLAVNALIDAVGVSHGMRNAVYGGTILLVDSHDKLLFKLEQDGVKELADRLADAGY